MNIVVLMAGEGKRFTDVGWTIPKPFINVHGKTIIEHTLDSCPAIQTNPDDKIFFAIRWHDMDYIQLLKDRYGNNIQFLIFEQLTRGNLETAYKVIDRFKFSPDEDLLILDCDNAYFHNGLMETIELAKSAHGDNMVVTYFDAPFEANKWACIELHNNSVTKIVEKPATNSINGFHPLMGVFWFSRTDKFKRIAELIMDSMHTTSNEFFVSQVASNWLYGGSKVFAHHVTNPLPLGTPEDVKRAVHFTTPRQLRLAIDVDGTLCHTKGVGQTYADVLPLDGAVETMQRWKDQGHYLIIQTARHMRTCDANEGKVLAMGAKLLVDWLDKHHIPYDEIRFGKPHVDIFIDDKGYRHTDWKDTAEFIHTFSTT